VPLTVDGVTERAGVDINVLPTRPGTIRGTIIGSPSPGTPVQVLLHNTDPAEEPTSLTARAGPDGSFALGPVPPGQYTVFAQTLPSETDGRPVVVPLVRSASFDRRHGRTSLTVEGGDPDPIAIVLRPGRSISGRVVLDLPPAARATGQRAPITISIVPAPQPAGWPAFNTSPQAQVDSDGMFTLPGIRPGRYFLRAAGPGLVKSVMWNGTDTLDVPLEVTADDDVGDVVITLTDRSSSLAGLVSDRAGDPVYDCTVIVVSTDARFWFPGSRRVAITEPSPDGRYAFSGLPAGEYRVAAVAGFDPARRFDPLFLQQLAATSVTITITDNGRHTQALRLD
jgi:hypothetical protein